MGVLLHDVGTPGAGEGLAASVVGERMTLAADFGTSEIRAHINRHIQGSEGRQAPEGVVETRKATGPEPLRRELERFVDAVAHRARPPVDVEAGLLVAHTVEGAQRSSALIEPAPF